MTFHSAGSATPRIFSASHGSAPSACACGNGASVTAGMLLRFTDPTRDTSVTANVALSSGSSQHGNAFLAEIGWKCVSAYVPFAPSRSQEER